MAFAGPATTIVGIIPLEPDSPLMAQRARSIFCPLISNRFVAAGPLSKNNNDLCVPKPFLSVATCF